jgi:CO/xanthine dehydrogenase FAD-binding subunit
MFPNFDYVRPKSLQAAITHLSDEGAVVHAGGTDLLGCLREHIFAVKKVVSISAVRELHGIAEGTGGTLRIGALTTLRTVAEHPLVYRRFSGLAQAASEVASPQLRNQGTIGGNICQKPRCWYYRGDFNCLRKGGGTCFAVDGENQFHCIFGGGGTCFMVHPSDTAPCLVALNATARVAGPSGVRDVPLERFHVLPEVDVRRETVLEPREIVAEIRIPPTGRRNPKLVPQGASAALLGFCAGRRCAGAQIRRQAGGGQPGGFQRGGSRAVAQCGGGAGHPRQGTHSRSHCRRGEGRCCRGRASRKKRLQDSAVSGCDRRGVDPDESLCVKCRSCPNDS